MFDEGDPVYRWQRRNYARLLLLGRNRGHIERVLKDVRRIQGEKSWQDLRDTLNRERADMKAGVELIKPKCVRDMEAKIISQPTGNLDLLMQRHEESIEFQRKLHHEKPE